VRGLDTMLSDLPVGRGGKQLLGRKTNAAELIWPRGSLSSPLPIKKSNSVDLRITVSDVPLTPWRDNSEFRIKC
jgi:hypothetical protein